MVELESLLPCIETKFHIWNPLEIVWIMNWHRTLREDLYCTALTISKSTHYNREIFWRWFNWRLLNISTNGAISTFNLTQFNIPNKFQSINCYISTYNQMTSLWNFVYEILKKKKDSSSYLKSEKQIMNVILIFMNIAIHDRQISIVTENNIEDILNPIFVTFIFTRRIQIFVIIFRRLRFVESFGKVMRRKKYTKTDCQRRISHALEKYL